MSKKIIITKSLKETKTIAEALAKKVLKKNGQASVVLALVGDLGSGKTSFLQGFAKGLGVKERILSPTFVILKKFELKTKSFNNFYHVDCYRLNGSKDLKNIDLETIINQPKNIVAIEWADRIKQALPPRTISLNFQVRGEKEREITIVDKKRVLF